jgi:nitrogen fixation protein NifQ
MALPLASAPPLSRLSTQSERGAPCSFSIPGEGDLYGHLVACGEKAGRDPFDAHVVASILAISFIEAKAEGRALEAAAGLAGGELRDLIALFFPNAAGWLAPFEGQREIVRGDDEACLVDLLERWTTSRSRFEITLARMIGRRAQRPNHLWQDLGLRDRRELSELMKRYFRPLALRNSADMKWKKFLYRMICADASYTLCTAPSCGECDDFYQCFGEETGESLLARVRRATEAD